jgi:hypothetical protein
VGIARRRGGPSSELPQQARQSRSRRTTRPAAFLVALDKKARPMWAGPSSVRQARSASSYDRVMIF